MKATEHRKDPQPVSPQKLVKKASVEKHVFSLCSGSRGDEDCSLYRRDVFTHMLVAF